MALIPPAVASVRMRSSNNRFMSFLWIMSFVAGFKHEGWGFSFLCCQVPLLFLLQSCRGGWWPFRCFLFVGWNRVWRKTPTRWKVFNCKFREFAETAKEKLLFLPNNKDFCKVFRCVLTNYHPWQWSGRRHSFAMIRCPPSLPCLAWCGHVSLFPTSANFHIRKACSQCVFLAVVVRC